MKNEIAQNIRARRVAQGLSLADLAERMFGDRRRDSYIHKVEAGGYDIRVSRLNDFATALNCLPADLMPTATHKKEHPK